MKLHKSIFYFGKLTKKLLMSLPEGFYLSSGKFEIKFPEVPPFTPLLREQVASKENREAQWKKIVDLKVNQRMVFVFRNKKAYLDCLDNTRMGEIITRPDWA